VIGGTYLGYDPSAEKPIAHLYRAYLGVSSAAFALAFCLSTYFGRFLSNYDPGQKGSSDYDISANVIGTLIVAGIWTVQVAVGLGFAVDQSDESYIVDQGVKMAIIAFCFMFISSMINFVFYPIIPYWFQSCGITNERARLVQQSNDLSDENDKSWFVKFFSYYGTPIFRQYGDRRMIMLATLFMVSVIFMNIGMAMYYTSFQTPLVLSGLISSVLTLFVGICQIYAYMREGENISDYSLKREISDGIGAYQMIFWIYYGVAMVLFFVYLPYNGWSDDPHSKAKAILYVTQGAVLLGIPLLIGLVFLLRNCTCTEEWQKARTQVQGYSDLVESDELDGPDNADEHV